MTKTCFYCKGTGKYKVPTNKDEFNIEFNRLEDLGIYTTEVCREKALESTGWKWSNCPECNN